MATAAELYNAMQGKLSQYEEMAPADRSAIQRDMASRVDYFRPQYQELAGMESSAYSAPARLMEQYQQNYGNIGGPGAMSRLSSMLGNIGQQYGTADVLGNVINTQRGRLEDMVGNAYDLYNSQRDAQMQGYQARMPLWQQLSGQEFDAAEAKKARDFQAAQAAAARAGSARAGSGGGGYVRRGGGGYGGVPNRTPAQAPMPQVTREVNMGGGMLPTYDYRKQHGLPLYDR